MAQIPLNIALADQATFDTFHPGDNALVIDALRTIQSPGVWLYGTPGSGKSHLLQATSALHDGMYLSLDALSPTEMLENLARYSVVALDDVDCVLGDRAWESALVALYNQLLISGSRLLVSTTLVPRDCTPILDDLQSRLHALGVFKLADMDDDAKLAALTMRAKQRGLTPDTRAIQYLIEHTERSMHALYQTLCALDRASWETGRRLTLPFVRTFLSDVASEQQAAIRRNTKD